MQWWNDFVDWLSSDDGWRVLSAAVIPFVAIIIAGLIAALIGRGSARRVLAFHDRELKASAIATLIGVGRKAASWSSLSTPEQQHYDTLISEADARMRLLPVAGSTVAADWAAHQIAEMKRNSAIFSFQAEQTLEEFRDRLIEWQHKPSRARKLLKADLEQWKFQKPSPEQELSVKQQEWTHQQPASPAADEPAREVAPATPAVVVASPEPSALSLTPAVTPPVVPLAAPIAADEPKPYATPATDAAEGFSPPITANTVRQRINPPTDD